VASLSLTGAICGHRNKVTWNPWWILAWYVTTIAWIVYGLWARDFSRGATAFVLLFVLQELYAIRKT
jgi:hypothetical protein